MAGSLEIEMAYPLAWPTGRPRTPSESRKLSLFRVDGRAMTLTAARRRLRDQLPLMTRTGQSWRTTDVRLSTKRHHPDAGGNRIEWDRLNQAYEQARAACQ